MAVDDGVVVVVVVVVVVMMAMVMVIVVTDFVTGVEVVWLAVFLLIVHHREK